MKLPLLQLCLLSASFSVALGQVRTEEASKITSQINALMSDFTDTVVIPTDHADGVIVLSQKVLQSEKIASMWRFVSACAIGKHLNDHSELELREIWFTDIGQMKSNPMRYEVLPASVAKSVQAKVSAGDMEIAEAQRVLSSKLVPKSKAR